VPTDEKFTGQRLDSTTGLYYYGARYYDPAIGRFISADTIVPDWKNPQAWNPYSYVLNNPLKYTDANGHIPLVAIFGGLFAPVLGPVAVVVLAIGLVGSAVYGGYLIADAINEASTSANSSPSLPLEPAATTAALAASYDPAEEWSQGYAEATNADPNNQNDPDRLSDKIRKQMESRGWTENTIKQTLDDSFTTRVATDKATGNAATAYYNADGSYVVADNITGKVIQISNRFDRAWIPDDTIINPYFP